MSSKIEQIIDEIEEYIDNCKPHNFSSSKIVVNRDEIDELLTELRMKTPGGDQGVIRRLSAIRRRF